MIRVISCMAATLSLLVLTTSCEKETSSPAKPGDKKGSGPSAMVQTTITEVTSAEAKKRLADGSGVLVIDVRTPAEFEAGHIEGAKNIDFKGTEFEKGVQALDRKTTYLVHCHGGGRSGDSKAVFQKLGFVNILHLTKGLGEWESQGNALVK